MENGKRVWKDWEELEYSDEDFTEVGNAFEKSINYEPKLIEQTESRLVSMRELVDFAVDWFRKNRKYNEK